MLANRNWSSSSVGLEHPANIIGTAPRGNGKVTGSSPVRTIFGRQRRLITFCWPVTKKAGGSIAGVVLRAACRLVVRAMRQAGRRCQALSKRRRASPPAVFFSFCDLERHFFSLAVRLLSLHPHKISNFTPTHQHKMASVCNMHAGRLFAQPLPLPPRHNAPPSSHASPIQSGGTPRQLERQNVGADVVATRGRRRPGSAPRSCCAPHPTAARRSASSVMRASCCVLCSSLRRK